MKTLEKVGTIIDTFGIRGQVKIFSEVSNLKDFIPLLKDHKLNKINISGCKIHKNDIWIATIDGINTCNVAENLKRTELFVYQGEFPKLKSGYYNFEMIGCNVSEENCKNIIGTVENVLNFKYTNVLEIRIRDKNFNRGNIQNDILYVGTNDVLKIKDNILYIKDIPEILEA